MFHIRKTEYDGSDIPQIISLEVTVGGGREVGGRGRGGGLFICSNALKVQASHHETKN